LSVLAYEWSAKALDLGAGEQLAAGSASEAPELKAAIAELEQAMIFLSEVFPTDFPRG
jgi:hypothetical protein